MVYFKFQICTLTINVTLKFCPKKHINFHSNFEQYNTTLILSYNEYPHSHKYAIDREFIDLNIQLQQVFPTHLLRFSENPSIVIGHP